MNRHDEHAWRSQIARAKVRRCRPCDGLHVPPRKVWNAVPWIKAVAAGVLALVAIKVALSAMA